jgi:hypothetical protein
MAERGCGSFHGQDVAAYALLLTEKPLLTRAVGDRRAQQARAALFIARPIQPARTPAVKSP